MVKFSAVVGNEERELVLEAIDEGHFRAVLDGVERIVDARRVDATTWSLAIDGEIWLVDVEVAKDGAIQVEVRGTEAKVHLMDSRRKLIAQAAAKRTQGGGLDTLRAPMPGKVVKVLVKAGDAVTAGQGVVVVEAMKMENELRAPRDGVIKEVLVKEGQPVEAQEPLATLE